MSGYLADTSVFVAAEQRRPLGAPPGGAARISVATLTELAVGARMAEGTELRLVREETLRVAARFVALPYDAPYVALARRDDIPLVTLDKRLGRAARAMGVEVLVPG